MIERDREGRKKGRRKRETRKIVMGIDSHAISVMQNCSQWYSFLRKCSTNGFALDVHAWFKPSTNNKDLQAIILNGR